MGKFKGVLKRISGGLKVAFLPIGITMAAGGALVGLSTAIAYSVEQDKVVSQYVATEEYQNYVHDEVMKLEEQYQNGQIVLPEYIKQVDELKEEDFDKIVEIAKKNAGDNEEILKRIQIVENLKTTGMTCMGLMAAGLVDLFLFLGLGDKILDSARDDFEAANEEFEKSGKNEKKIKTVEKVKPKPKKEVEVVVEQDKELKSTSDEYYKEI